MGSSRTLLLTAGVCLVCSLLVSSAAVLLRDRQTENRELDWQRRVLGVCGVDTRGLDPDAVLARFARDVETRPITLADATRRNVYFVSVAVDRRVVVLPIEGEGMWSTLRGLLALSASDFNTIVGIDFYEQAETPGLGAEISDPGWQARWRTRRAYEVDSQPAIRVIKGVAGPPEDDPYRVDGISGATITSRAVSKAVRQWLGAHGYGPFLERQREGGDA